MKTSFVAALSAIALVAAAPATVEKRTPGPSGSLSFPYGGATIAKGSPLYISYNPVNSQGQVTTGISVELIMNARADILIFPLANGLSAQLDSETINAYFNAQTQNPDGHTVTPCGEYTVRVTESQTGPIYTGSFISAQPTITFAC